MFWIWVCITSWEIDTVSKLFTVNGKGFSNLNINDVLLFTETLSNV